MYRMRWLCTRQDNVLVRSLVRFRTVLHQWRFILLFLDKELMSAERFRDLLPAQKDLAIGAKGYALDPQHFIWRLLLKSGNSKAMCGNKLRREVCINSFYSFEGFKGGVGFNSFLLDYILNLSPNKNQVDQRFISMKIILNIIYADLYQKSKIIISSIPMTQAGLRNRNGTRRGTGKGLSTRQRSSKLFRKSFQKLLGLSHLVAKC